MPELQAEKTGQPMMMCEEPWDKIEAAGEANSVTFLNGVLMVISSSLLQAFHCELCCI